MIGTIFKKPRITVLTELPILAMAVNAPIHLEKEVISLNNKEHMSMKAPLCSSWCVSPILLTDDIKKCTCSNILEYFYSLNEFDSFWRLPLVFFLKTFYNKIVLNFS